MNYSFIDLTGNTGFSSTPEEIKTSYEGNPDTNAFTDALKSAVQQNKVKDVSANPQNNTLTFTYMDDTTNIIDLTTLVTDVYVSGASLNATSNILTLSSTEGGSDVTVDLSDFVNSTELNNDLDTKVDKINSTDNSVARFDGTTGAVQDSGVTIDDSNNLVVGGDLTVNKDTTSASYRSSSINTNKRLFDINILDDTGVNSVRLFRNTNNTFEKSFQILRGDNTSVAQHKLNSEGRNSYLCNLGGNLGVGITNPERIIHSKSSVPSIRLEDKDVLGLYYELLGQVSGQFDLRIDEGNVQSGSSFNIRIDGLSRMKIDDIGNIGIGTSTPTEKLEVSGEVKATVDGISHKLSEKTNQVDFERYFKFQNWKNTISGGGDITWGGNNLSTSNRLIVIPTNESDGYIKINLTSLNVPNWSIVYIDLTDTQLTESALPLTQDDFTVESFTSYTEATSQNRFILGYCNGDTKEFVFSNGLTVNNMNNRDSGWINVTYKNGWSSFSTGFNVARYRKIGSVVYIEGLVKDGTINQPIFTLPVGFRPTKRSIRATVSNGDLGRLDIDSSGNVLPVNGSNVWFSVECNFTV